MANTSMFAILLALYTLHIHTPPPFSGAPNIVIAKKTKLPLRLHHSISSFSLGHQHEDDRRAPVVASTDGSIFLVNISVGSPPAPQLLGMDTGSDLTWVRCTFCFWCRHDVFHYEKSSTFRWLRPTSYQCHDSSQGSPYDQTGCPFHVKYADQSAARGYMATDTFTYLTATGGIEQVPQAVFGCAERVVGHNAVDMNGILALGYRTRNRILDHIDKRFSYCIGSLENTVYKYNHLILGEGAIIQGDSTPFRANSAGHYTVSLEGISVGEKELKINQTELKFNVVVDSGSTMTELVKSAHEPLVAELRQLLSGVAPSIRTYKDNPYCYRGDLEGDLKGFPTVTLRFAEGAELALEVDGLFRRTPFFPDFCLTVVESRFDYSVIGLVSQQFYNVGYDLDEKRISFQRIDCELLED